MTEDEYARIDGGRVEGHAIFFMKSRKPNADGTLGFIVTPELPEWRQWERYFSDNRMHRNLSMMRSRGPAGYMVPHASPQVFDPAWRPRHVDTSVAA